MPLSDEENRILREIEQQLYESDPDLARHEHAQAQDQGQFRPHRTIRLM